MNDGWRTFRFSYRAARIHEILYTCDSLPVLAYGYVATLGHVL
jgi:hypothetical protein